MRLHVACRTLNIDLAARGDRLDSGSWPGHANDTGKGAHPDIPFDVRHRYASRNGRYAEIIANFSCGDGAAGRRELSVALGSFDADGPRGGLHLYRAAHPANGLRAGRDGGTYFRIARHQNRIGDADVTHVSHFLADANDVASLFDGRIRESIVQALLRIVEAESRCAHFAAHMYFAVGACCDVHVTGGVGELQAGGAVHVIVAIEGAAD